MKHSIRHHKLRSLLLFCTLMSMIISGCIFKSKLERRKKLVLRACRHYLMSGASISFFDNNTFVLNYYGFISTTRYKGQYFKNADTVILNFTKPVGLNRKIVVMNDKDSFLFFINKPTDTLNFNSIFTTVNVNKGPN